MMSCFNLRAARASSRGRNDDLHLLPSVAQAMSVPLPAWHTALLVVPLASIIFDVVSDGALGQWMNEPVTPSPPMLEPVTFFRPLKRGVPRLREKLEMLLEASLPADQILLGV